MSNKELFVEYMQSIKHNFDSQNYQSYIDKKLNVELGQVVMKISNKKLFEIDNIDDLEDLSKILNKKNPQWYEYSYKKNSHGIPNAMIFTHYKNFLKEKNNSDIFKQNNYKQALNQILYGPPGTGKTYNTVIKAMEIIGSKKVQMFENNNFRTDYSEEEYKILKEEFDEYKKLGQIEFVTFHQSYSYEEFVEGIKPYILEWGFTENTEVKYVGEDGIFKRMCSFKYLWEMFKKNHPVTFEMKTVSDGTPFKITEYRKDNFKVDKIGNLIPINELEKVYEHDLRQHFKIQHEIRDFISDNRYASYCFSILKELNKPRVLIIDEINRGDISKIFGELITLIEEDKRTGNKYQMKTTLPYSKEPFGVPNNLYIIGTMNTADRSIALLDTALRRRFDFEEIMPRPELLNNQVVEGTNINLQTLLTKINERITNKYDRDHQIGHSYFMGVDTKEQLERVYKNRILPLLNEYFYNESKTVAEVLNCSEDELKMGNFITILCKAQGT